MDITFCKLRNKEVVNVCDGKNLGNITDIVIDTNCGRVIGLIVPANSKNFLNFFKSNNDIFIPYNRICKIGKDIILVDIIMQQDCNTISSLEHTIQCNNNECSNNNKINIQSILNNINNQNQR
jgi:YlmC/YmxH family sporulation protein